MGADWAVFNRFLQTSKKHPWQITFCFLVFLAYFGLYVLFMCLGRQVMGPSCVTSNLAMIFVTGVGMGYGVSLFQKLHYSGVSVWHYTASDALLGFIFSVLDGILIAFPVCNIAGAICVWYSIVSTLIVGLWQLFCLSLTLGWIKSSWFLITSDSTPLLE